MTVIDSRKTENTPEEKHKESVATGTPYDDAFRTMTNESYYIMKLKIEAL